MRCLCDWEKDGCEGRPTDQCRRYHAEYMRAWRWGRVLTSEERRKDSVRSKASMAKRRGRLLPQPCEVCGRTDRIEMHHDDYSRPLKVRWFCRAHHLQLEQLRRA
jgi:hypothetical protein